MAMKTWQEYNADTEAWFAYAAKLRAAEWKARQEEAAATPRDVALRKALETGIKWIRADNPPDAEARIAALRKGVEAELAKLAA